jgi:hypothetical protein
MKTVRRKDLGEILPIDVSQQPRKVVKHLYNGPEHWDPLIDHDVSALVAEALAAGVTATPGRDADLDPKARSTITLHRHHDAHYGPAYLRSLATETTRWAPQTIFGRDRALACSREGMLIAFDRGNRCKVVTAFRPKLPLPSVQPTEHDFAMEAESRWRQSVDSSTNQIGRDDLRDALDGDRGDLASAWRLAAAVGRATLSTPIDFRDLVARAEAKLAAIDRAVRDELIVALEACTPLDAFADAIQEGDDAEALDGLIALEGLIAAATALGASELAERLVEETAVRATCVGPNLLGLASFAEARAHSTTEILSRYWREVSAEIVANAIRLAPPVRSHRELLALPSAWLRAQLEAVGASFTEMIAGASIPQPHLSSRPHSREVIAHGWSESSGSLRAFVVDRDNPTGIEVSDLIQRQDDGWSFKGWRVDPNDEAILVIVNGARPGSEAPTLADLFTLVGEPQDFDAISLMDAR